MFRVGVVLLFGGSMFGGSTSMYVYFGAEHLAHVAAKAKAEGFAGMDCIGPLSFWLCCHMGAVLPYKERVG